MRKDFDLQKRGLILKGKVLTYFIFSIFLTGLFSSRVFALKVSTIKIKIPEHTFIQAPQFVKVKNLLNGNYRLYFNKSTVFPFEIKIQDLFGAHINLYIKDPLTVDGLEVKTGIVENPRPNPVVIYNLPKLCPRASLINKDGNKRLVYDAKKDFLNEKPFVLLFDPDIKTSFAQKTILDHFDDKNVLTVKKIKITYDFEDDSIVDYEGPHPLTGKPHLVYEGNGGFYANFHYAVVPYDEGIKKLNRQEVLNLAQGKLGNIGRKDLTPALRTHSFLPGPYLSKDQLYPLCEWGDTAFQSKKQIMYYNGLKIWDWDLKTTKGNKPGRLLIIVWEGDEEDWLISRGLLDPFYLTDDLIGIFEVRRDETIKPLLLKNKAQNFEMLFQTK